MLKQLGTWPIHLIWFILLLGAYLVNSLLLQIATDSAHRSPATAEHYIFLTIITGVVLIVMYTWIYRRQIRANNPRNFRRAPVSAQRILVLIGAFVLILAIQVVWSQLIMHHVMATPSNQTAVDAATVQLPLWNTLYDTFMAPLFEEFIFRGFFFNLFFTSDTPLSNGIGILVSGLLFGYMHTFSLDTSLIFYTALGCVMAWTYLHFRDLRYNVTLHFMNNFWAIL